MELAPHRTEVDGNHVFTFVLPKRSRTDLPRDMDTVDANLYKINEMMQHAEDMAFEAVRSTIPQLVADLPQLPPHYPATWSPQSFTHNCSCVNGGRGDPLDPNYLLVTDTHLEAGGPVYTPSSTVCCLLHDQEAPQRLHLARSSFCPRAGMSHQASTPQRGGQGQDLPSVGKAQQRLHNLIRLSSAWSSCHQHTPRPGGRISTLRTAVGFRAPRNHRRLALPHIVPEDSHGSAHT